MNNFSSCLQRRPFNPSGVVIVYVKEYIDDIRQHLLRTGTLSVQFDHLLTEVQQSFSEETDGDLDRQQTITTPCLWFYTLCHRHRGEWFAVMGCSLEGTRVITRRGTHHRKESSKTLSFLFAFVSCFHCDGYRTFLGTAGNWVCRLRGFWCALSRHCPKPLFKFLGNEPSPDMAVGHKKRGSQSF